MRRDRRLRDAHLVDVDDAVASLFQILYLYIRCGRLFLHLHLLFFADDLRLPDLLLADPCLPIYLAEVIDCEFGIRMHFFEFFAPLMQ